MVAPGWVTSIVTVAPPATTDPGVVAAGAAPGPVSGTGVAPAVVAGAAVLGGTLSSWIALSSEPAQATARTTMAMTASGPARRPLTAAPARTPASVDAL